MTRNSPYGSIFALVGFLGLMALIVGAVMRWKGHEENAHTLSTPNEMTLAELLTKGPGDNHYVQLSRFQVGADYVRWSKGGDAKSYFMLTTLDPIPSGKPKQLLVEKIDQDKKASQTLSQPILRGIYRPENATELGREGRSLIKEKYPHVDFDKLPMLEAREPDGDRMKRNSLVAIVGGVMMLLVSIAGITWFVRKVKRLEQLNPPTGTP